MKSQAVFLRSPYNYNMMDVSDETGLSCADPSRTKQSFAEEADINTLVMRFGLTGKLPENVRVPEYGDFVDVGSYQESLNFVIAAEESFMKMPAHVRSRFHNDPGAFLDFVHNDANRAEAEKLGIVVDKQGVADEAGSVAQSPTGEVAKQGA